MSAFDDAASSQIFASHSARADDNAGHVAADHDLPVGTNAGPASGTIASTTAPVSSERPSSTRADARESSSESDRDDADLEDGTEAVDCVRGTAELHVIVRAMIGRLVDAATASPGGACAAHEELTELRDDLQRRTTACALNREALAQSAPRIWRVFVSPGLIGVGGPPPLAVWASVAETRGWVALTAWWPANKAPHRDGVHTLEAEVARVLGVPADRVYTAVLADLDGQARAALARGAVRIDPPLSDPARPDVRRPLVTPIDLEFASDADLIHWVSPHDSSDELRSSAPENDT